MTTRVYYDTDGVGSTIPFDREEAERVKSRIYVGDPCPDCGKREKYTKNDVCVQCALLNANDLFCYIAGKMHWEYHPDDPMGIPPLAVHVPVVIMGRERKYFKDRMVTWEHERAVSRLTDLVATPDRQRFARSPREAIDLGKDRFVIPTSCEIAGHYGIRTLENRCHFCEEERVKKSARALARRDGKQWYTPVDPCPRCGQIAERRVADNRCSGCFPMLRENTYDPARAAARINGKAWYTPTTPCPKCGGYDERRTQDNRCSGCYQKGVLSPRKAALVAGNVWYTPEKPCPYCGTRADRRVYDGRCSGCIPTTTGSKNATTIMMENAPDMIISREDARRMQLKVFRTGAPCRRGHRGFRWTSTGNCIPCAKGER